MNPLNPWVALIELLLLLGGALGLGWVVARLQYRHRINGQKQAIEKIHNELKDLPE